ncbi:MAG TPA: glycosyltransferase family 2 protein [Clostridia bacterium]|nr:glycosyltransferase family 2 protein [Clostridia bacterium]
MNKITVFTPTYNRADTLPRLYTSLYMQTCIDFEWLIVDDGSIDDTEKLINEFKAEGKITIKYVRQENGGKHRAFNTALSVVDTPLFFCVDSDDMLTNNAIERILWYEEKYFDQTLLGFYFRRGNIDGYPIGKQWPENVQFAPIIDLYDKYKFSGDTAIILKTHMVSSICFPIFNGEKFVTESVFYNLLNNIAPMAYINEIIYLCEYREDGYTRNWERILVNNPRGTALYFLSDALYRRSLDCKFKKTAQYFAWCYVLDINVREYDYMQKHISLFVRIIGKVLSLHYIMRFTKMREEYTREA